MPLLETFLVNQFGTFVLVLARVGALVMSAPIFGTRAAPVQARGALAIVLSLLITPLHSATPAADFTHLLAFSKFVACETMLGLLLGLGVTILLHGVQLTGQIISQLGGTAIAEGVDPNLEESAPVYSQMFYFLTLAMFVLLDGHRLMLEALLDTYAWLPPGRAELGKSYVTAMTTLLGQSFALGIRAAAPGMAALLLATLVLGLIGRTVPQINILAVGFNLNALLTVAILMASVGTIGWAFPNQAADALGLLRDAIREASNVAAGAVGGVGDR
jgi:flagellar biosynthetic protein FliR